MTRRTNAKIAGFSFLFYILIGVTQMVLAGALRAQGTAAKLAMIAQHAPQVRFNMLLSLLESLSAFALAMSLYGLTREEDPDLAVTAFACRVGEGLVGAIAPIATLGLLWLAAGTGPGAPDAAAVNVLGGFLFQVRGWDTTLSATLFALGSTLFSWLLLRGRMIPTPLAWLGVIASVLLVVGLPLQLAGFLTGPVPQFMWLPMAAFEIPLGIWLLIKGVRPLAHA